MEQEINYIVHKLLIASITKNRWSKIVFENVRKASFSRKTIPFSESRPPSSPRFRREASTRFRVVHTTEIEIYISTNLQWSELARGAKSFGNIGSNFEKFVSIGFFFLFLFFFLMRTLRGHEWLSFSPRKEKRREGKYIKLDFWIRVDVEGSRNKYLSLKTQKLYFLPGGGDWKLFALTEFKVETARDRVGKILFIVG